MGRISNEAIVGVSLTVAPPLGQYDPTKLINLGTNRWSFKPEVGLSRTYGKWVVEAMAGVWLFTDNTDFVGGRTREQDPIVAAQFHVTYKFTRAHVAGGRRQLLHGRTDDDRRHAEPRPPAQLTHRRDVFARRSDRHQAIRMSVSRGAYTTIGADFTSIAVGYNYAWARAMSNSG